MRITFFIGSLRSGGKERRLVELLSYLKRIGGYDIQVILAYYEISYPQFSSLGIKVIDLNKHPNSKDVRIFFKLYKIINGFKPDVIHTWGSMQTFYSIPSAKLLGIPLINSQITDAPPKLSDSVFSKFENWINFKFSTVNLANSYAGLSAYNQLGNIKSKVIYNGLNPRRFQNLKDKCVVKEEYNIKTKYSVIMSASFSMNKDWDRFYSVAKYVTDKKEDVSFIGVGAPSDEIIYNRMVKLSDGNKRIIFPGRTSEVENLVNACDIGVLFSTNGEGISNSILEYMALSKPVIVDECGGTPEFVEDGYNGFFTTNKSIEDIADLIIKLFEDEELRKNVGENGYNTIQNKFTLDSMGKEFVELYNNVIRK